MCNNHPYVRRPISHVSGAASGLIGSHSFPPSTPAKPPPHGDSSLLTCSSPSLSSRRAPLVAGDDRSGARSIAPPAPASAPARRRRRPRWRCGTSSRARTAAPRTAPRRPTPSTPSPTPSSASPPRLRWASVAFSSAGVVWSSEA